ncbi:MAG: FAD-binding oxidoreductase [Deltaproteobacteria bacterium]|nr:FAD-binding oxidoreductase [Deltaproteobacteria bacterium]
MPERRTQIWGWGYEDQQPTPEQQKAIAKGIVTSLGCSDVELSRAPTIDEIVLRAPRITPPPALAGICSTATYDRAAHSYGKAFPDLLRAFRREFPNPPDVVAYSRTEADVVALLDWCAQVGAAAIPFGGGSSVAGGVEPPPGDVYGGVVSIDLRRLDRVLEIDKTSRAARIQAGVYGPALEDQLRPHGYTLRHYPQSFEFSSLGGWIATRSGGHFATLYTHIDDFVESLRVVTPRGIVASRRLPGSGAGPSPDRMFIGSEGILGIITEAWMRLQDRPVYRASTGVRFARFESGVAAVRAISQAGLYPTNCRLLDPAEVARNKVGDGTGTMLMLGFESADHPLDTWINRALECCADHGGTTPNGVVSRGAGEVTGRGGSVGDWRDAFIRMPYQLGTIVAMGAISDTVESAITWERFAEFHAGVMEATQKALDEVCGGGVLSCRFTHVYPDGPAPYYTFLGLGRRGGELEQWRAVKTAAADAVIRHGGTITHHHAVGRIHRPWYDRQRPDLFATALRAAKAALDPQGLLNPGVLIDP